MGLVILGVKYVLWTILGKNLPGKSSSEQRKENFDWPRSVW